MSQTKQQGRGAGPTAPRVREDWELFWRIIAGLMLVIIGWIVWVLYEISPRSVVTPLAYEFKVRPIGRQSFATGATGTIASPPPAAATPAALPETAAVPQTSSEAAAAALAMEEAQAAARSGAHEAAADVQAAALEARPEQLRLEEHPGREGLKLSTEITTPLAERKRITKKKQGNPGGASPAPTATDAAGKARP